MASTEEEVSVDGTYSKLEVDSVLYTVNLYSTKKKHQGHTKASERHKGFPQCLSQGHSSPVGLSSHPVTNCINLPLSPSVDLLGNPFIN